MKILRLTTVLGVIRHWPFFIEGFSQINEKAKENFDLDQMQKTLFHHARLHQHAYICVAYIDREPVGFLVMEEATPMFAPFRSCIARAVYSAPGVPAVGPMMNEFEAWAKGEGFEHYVITTRRHSGAALRFFQSPKFGFKRGYITFEKSIS